MHGQAPFATDTYKQDALVLGMSPQHGARSSRASTNQVCLTYIKCQAKKPKGRVHQARYNSAHLKIVLQGLNNSVVR